MLRPPALSLRAPWWWFILHGGKDVENRDWLTTYRGPVILHASSWWSGVQVQQAWADGAGVMTELGLRKEGEKVTLQMLKDSGGHLVGMFDITGCVTASGSPWRNAEAKFAFTLANPRPFQTPIKCLGQRGFFNLNNDVWEQVKGQVTL